MRVDRENLRGALAVLLAMGGFIGGISLALGAESDQVAFLAFLFAIFALLTPFLVAAVLPSPAVKSHRAAMRRQRVSGEKEQARRQSEGRRFLIIGVLLTLVGTYILLAANEWGLGAITYVAASLSLVAWYARR